VGHCSAVTRIAFSPDGRLLATAVSPIPIRKVTGLGCKVTGLESKVMGLGYKVTGLGRKVMGLQRRVTGLGRTVTELGRQLGRDANCLQPRRPLPGDGGLLYTPPSSRRNTRNTPPCTLAPKPSTLNLKP